MAFSMKIWRVQEKDLHEVNRETLNNENRLKEWVIKDPAILGINLLLIGTEVRTASGKYLDLLAIDNEANLVVLELKRGMSPREVVAQTLDYASWVNHLSFDQIDSVAKSFTGKSLSQAFEDYYGFSIPQTVNGNHSMVILTSELDDSSERIVEYLSEEYGVPINVLFFTFFKDPNGEFLGRAWLKDPEEMQERVQARKQAPWSGFYFVNVGESDGQHRNWDDCREYGFLSAGHGEKYGNAMKKLKVNDRVFAYMKGHGYVGFGTVTQMACMVRDFTPDGFQKKLLDLPLKQQGLGEFKNDPLLTEWVVGIKWEKTFDRNDAKWFKEGFANQNVVCLLRHEATVDFLRKGFGVAT